MASTGNDKIKKILLKILLIVYLLFAFNAYAEVREITQNDNVNNIISGAVTGDIIRFFPGTYTVNIFLSDERNLRFEGVDTKNTILKSIDGETPIIEINGSATSTVIQNLTFLESEIGILVADSTRGLSILNNVFRLGVNNTAIEIGESVSADISNNTFYGNLINIENLSTAVVVKNNIFDSYNTFINGTVPNVVSFNCISQSENEHAANNDIITTADFVDVHIDVNDFHLKKDSDCIDAGEFESDFDDSQTDVGAYGGVGFDKIPDAVEIDEVKLDGTSTVVSWLKNEDHQVAGYKIYYRTQPIYTEEQDTYLTLDSRIDGSLTVINANLLLSATLSANLVVDPQIPTAPAIKVLPGNNKLRVSWDVIEGATSYALHYTGDEAPVEIDVGDVTTYDITGLNNDVIYTVWLVAKNQLSYYFQVVAYIDDPDDAGLTESFFTREDETLNVGTPGLSDESIHIAVQPEAIVAYPNLPNEGCFIATAAFGYYSAEQVQVLRGFRDRYLLTNEVGRDFVDWYYHYGPYAAEIITEYSLLKPVTRVFLYPLIMAAELLEISVMGFILYTVLCLMLILISLKLGINAVVSQFRRRVSVI